MKRLVMATIVALFAVPHTASAAPIQPYLDLGTVTGSVDEAEALVKATLVGGGFTILGAYAPAADPTLRAVAYTSEALVETLASLPPKRGFAGGLKVGLKREGSAVRVTMTDPDLIFRAYLQNDYAAVADTLTAVGRRAVALFSAANGFTGEATPMGGGALDTDDVAGYHYMFGMEYFEDQVKLTGGRDHDALVATVEKRLADGAAGARKVFALTYPRSDGHRATLFGVALADGKKGEPFFLPIIGIDHVAAMPYELLVVDGEAFTLHGRYRIALHWPALTMGTFSKIISTPGDVAETMKAVVAP
jgi:hypothetical protein